MNIYCNVVRTHRHNCQVVYRPISLYAGWFESTSSSHRIGRWIRERTITRVFMYLCTTVSCVVQLTNNALLQVISFQSAMQTCTTRTGCTVCRWTCVCSPVRLVQRVSHCCSAYVYILDSWCENIHAVLCSISLLSISNTYSNIPCNTLSRATGWKAAWRRLTVVSFHMCKYVTHTRGDNSPGELIGAIAKKR